MGNILVCDDERSICTMLDIALRLDGHHVETVTSGERAIQKLDSALYDVLVTDVRMPGISGLEVLHHARRVSPDTRVIVITAVDDNETSIQAQNAGALYVRKLGANLPTDVRAAVQSAMENQSLRQQNAVLKRDAAAHNSLDNIVGDSPVMDKPQAAYPHRGHHQQHRHRQRGERHRQRAGRPGNPRLLAAQRRAVRLHQLRRLSRDAAGKRAVRLRQGRVHRRQPEQARSRSNWRTAARSSSTKSARCLSPCR